MTRFSVMFHDPSLERTTGMKAIIRDSKWDGEEGIHRARTIKTPHQPIPTFVQTVELLMKVGRKNPRFHKPIRGSRNISFHVPDLRLLASFASLATWD